MPTKEDEIPEFVLIYETYIIMPSNNVTKVVDLGVSKLKNKKIAKAKAKEELKKIKQVNENIFNPRLAVIVKSL